MTKNFEPGIPNLAGIDRRLGRRRFVAGVGAAAAAASFPVRSSTAAKHRVVVVGGGFGGATCAKYLRLWGGDEVDVTLVDQSDTHVSCVMSNLVLNGELSLSRLSFDLKALSAKYDIRFVRDRAVSLDAEAGQLGLSGGSPLGFDRLVISTGIEFDPLPGWDPRHMPHAWIAGRQTLRLRAQLRRMPDGGTFLMTVPRAPYRCPPGPYERACTVADYLGRRAGVLGRGRSSGAAPKVIVLDENEGITAESETFTRAFTELYGDIIEYYPGIRIEAADRARRALETDMGAFSGDVVNVIPTHRASRFVERNGLAEGRWASVDPVTYGSKVPGFENIHVIGDSQGTGQPKSGHMANAQAKVCADAIVRVLAGGDTHSEERLMNLTTNSACFSPITRDEASWLTAVYSYDQDSRKMTLAPGSLGEAGDWDSESYEDMFTWSSNLFADTFM